MPFSDLPLELLPEILSHLSPRPQFLASACLVNSTINGFASPLLYSRVAIFPWHKRSKAKVVSLFTTFSTYPHLANHVRRLEIRDFPKSASSDGAWEDLVLRGLANCTELRACTWTRDGALTTDILRVLARCESLRELEVNGRSSGRYDPRVLPDMRRLSRISLIMPSLDVVRQLDVWMQRTGQTLSSLTLICKMSPLVTDDILQSLAPNLRNLEQLSLTGCAAVTDLGVHALLAANVVGIRSLSLEGFHQRRFDMVSFTARCAQTPHALASLRSFTLSLHSTAWLSDILALLSASPDLEQIQLYGAYGFADIRADSKSSMQVDAFWDALLATHAQRLTRVSVHRMPISLRAIREVCARARRLRQLFVVVEMRDLDAFVDCLAPCAVLEEVHVNFPTNNAPRAATTDPDSSSASDANSDTEEDASAPTAFLTLPRATALVRRCPSSIQLFGANTRVWSVGRVLSADADADGGTRVERVLGAYERAGVPEQFLVVRT
ncbi:F-box domain-containing protein [Mycena kentingensis (nom. inval.)]|nr:F-box domain-containing protein [Mycena kentingensis (nom. inval.)]